MRGEAIPTPSDSESLKVPFSLQNPPMRERGNLKRKHLCRLLRCIRRACAKRKMGAQKLDTGATDGLCAYAHPPRATWRRTPPEGLPENKQDHSCGMVLRSYRRNVYRPVVYNSWLSIRPVLRNLQALSGAHIPSGRSASHRRVNCSPALAGGVSGLL